MQEEEKNVRFYCRRTQQFVSNLPFQVLFTAAAWREEPNFQEDNELQYFFDVGVFVFSQQAALSKTTAKHQILLNATLLLTIAVTQLV